MLCFFVLSYSEELLGYAERREAIGRWGASFIQGKIVFLVSLGYFRQFHGIREGTIIAAFGVGKILSLYDPLKPSLLRFLRKSEA